MIRFVDLSSRYAVDLFFQKPFQPPPTTYSDTFITETIETTDELEKLLNYTPRQFWSTVIYNQSCQDCLIQSLQNLPRRTEYYRLVHQFKSHVKKISKIIKCILARIISRRDIQGGDKNMQVFILYNLYSIIEYFYDGIYFYPRKTNKPR